jgi:hypothetical protein
MKPRYALICSLLLSAAAPALAALGGDATSVEADRVRMKGTVRVTEQVNYAVHEIQTASGLVIHEYVSPGGRVFAVSWHGPGVPDLGQLLGEYSSKLGQLPRAPHYNHHHLAVETPEVVVLSSGRIRAYAGRAWAPALLPQNFSPNDID